MTTGYLLLLRFALLNMLAGALLTAAWLVGWVDYVRAADEGTYLVSLIVAVFAAGLAGATGRAWQLSRTLNRAKAAPHDEAARLGLTAPDPVVRLIRAAQHQVKLVARIAPIRQIAGWLWVLGLIGTVIGFIIALSGVDPAAAGDAAAIGPMVSTLVAGMSVALYTTLVGGILNIWLTLNYRLLEHGSVKLMSVLVDAGEAAGERHRDDLTQRLTVVADAAD